MELQLLIAFPAQAPGAHAEGFQSTWPQVVLPRPGPLAPVSDAGLPGWPGHFINLRDKTPEEDLLQS